MNNTLYFLRHGKTKVDSATPISQWLLSEVGEAQAGELAKSGIFDETDVIISSTEQKAIDTAKPIADKLGLEIQQEGNLSELNRDEGKFVSPEEYENLVEQAMTNREKSISNWETASHALARFTQAIEKIDGQHEGKNILIVGHGFTINLYFAQLLNELDKVYERLNDNDFADWGIVKNGKVIKDIAKK